MAEREYLSLTVSQLRMQVKDQTWVILKSVLNKYRLEGQQKPSLDCRYLGLYSLEVEAARAYDRESVLRKGVQAITNFALSEYTDLLSKPSISYPLALLSTL